MKLLIALLLVFCLINSAISGTTNCYNTLKNLSGYTTGTSSVGYNVDIDGNKSSYIENAIMSVDFPSQQIVYTISIVQPNGQPLNYDLYVYGANQTEYISVGGKCYTNKLQDPIPTSLPIVPANTNFVIGDIATESYFIKNNNDTNQILNVNPASCAMLVAFTENTSDDFGGNTIFINYSTNVNQSIFNLPSACYNAAPVQKENTHKLRARTLLF